MFDFQWPENLSIFLDNLCMYHVCFDLLSFFTIIFTWWFCRSSNIGSQGTVETDQEVTIQESDSSTNISANTQLSDKEEEKENYNILDWNDDSIVCSIKVMKQKALVKELQSKLTKEELEEEKQMEKMQLEKIFQLLQDQEDKFHMTSMEQLHDQLNLYRI